MDIEQAITGVHAAVARVDAAQEAVAAAKDILQREALRALVAAEDDDTTRELVRRLYWEVPELPTKTIEAVLGTRTRVFKLAGPGPVIGACDDCGTDIRATSRTHRNSGASVCEGCLDVRRKAEQERLRRLNGWEIDEPPPDDDWFDEPEDWPEHASSMLESFHGEHPGEERA
jgi:hypothetical protein